MSKEKKTKREPEKEVPVGEIMNKEKETEKEPEKEVPVGEIMNKEKETEKEPAGIVHKGEVVFDQPVVVDPIAEFERHYGEEIAWRVKAGLTREQAVDVVRAQVRHDAENEAKTKEEK